MRPWITCVFVSLSTIAFASDPREEVHAGVKVTFQSGADANPAGIISVATAFVDALNHQNTQEALKYVHQGQQGQWKTYLAKQQKKHELTIERILVFVGDYKSEGKRLRDQLMARVGTQGAGGKGGMSFLMLRVEDKWIVVID